MPRFINTPAQLSHVPTTNEWVVLRGFGFESSYANDVIWVSPGLTTDLASIPKFVKAIIDNDDPQILEASIIHDALYRRRSMPAIDRAMADKILYEAMWVLGAPRWKRHLVYWAVRAFGGAAWQQTRSR